ncbi:MAG: hypothetical protein CM15mV106_010 [uncultured marine virus]|nr:MAG: hypothetical protein CM15mV106_010 [uncultured marine virus]
MNDLLSRFPISYCNISRNTTICVRVDFTTSLGGFRPCSLMLCDGKPIPHATDPVWQEMRHPSRFCRYVYNRTLLCQRTSPLSPSMILGWVVLGVYFFNVCRANPCNIDLYSRFTAVLYHIFSNAATGSIRSITNFHAAD